MKLIVNSDDFGYTEGISKGILEGHKRGIITSTTVLVNQVIEPAYIEAVKRMGVGLHLNLSLGKPMSAQPHLTDEAGNFLPLDVLIEQPGLAKELEAQMQAFIEMFGQLPDHLDSHHGLHRHPQLKEIIEDMMERYQLKARELSGIKFIRSFYGEQASVDHLLEILEANQHEPVIEIMCHAGYSDVSLASKSRYHEGREVELNCLCDERVLEKVAQLGIELITYGDLA